MAGKTCVITGGTGAIGLTVANAFAKAGYAVTVASRSGFSGQDVCKFKAVKMDVTDLASIERGFKGADIVIHLAALLHINNPTAELQGDYQRVNVQGTRKVMHAASGQGVQRVVVASSISVYGNNRQEVLTEESELCPTSLYGQTKAEAERVALGFRGTDLRPLASILRLSAVYGPGMKGNYMSLLRALANRRFVPLGKGENSKTLVHAEDAAQAFLLAAESGVSAGKIYNVTDGAVHPLYDILASMSAALGRTSPSLHVPVPLARFAAAHVDTALRLGGSSKSMNVLLDKYLEDVRVSGVLISRELGFKPSNDLTTGWRHTVNSLRAAGRLEG